MRNLSRRGFFKKFGEAALDHTLPPKFEPRMESKPSGEFPLGRLSDFPPGEKRSFSYRGGLLVVSSSGEGLTVEWRVGETVSSVPLRLQRDGELMADLNQVCNLTSVFSLMTGEMTENE